MSIDAERSTPAFPEKPARPLWETFLVRGVIITLLIVLAVECASRYGYTTTLDELGKRTAVEEQTGTTPTLTDLREMARGWYFQSSTTGRPTRIVQLKWLSLFKSYVLQVRVAEEGDILEFSSNQDLVDPVAQQTRPLIKVNPVAGSTILLNPASDAHRVLARELVRQAFLMAAREEFQLATRDSAFREAVEAVEVSDSGERWPFVVEVGMDRTESIVVQITKITPQKREQVFFQRLKIQERRRLEELAVLADGWSVREFVDVLEKAGYSRKQPVSSATSVSGDVQSLMAVLNPVTQFAALRLLHSQLSQEQDSPIVRSALARTYALLGSLTDRHWSASHKLFKARAILSAQRCIRRWPEQPEVWWTRAFVRALCGLHQPALKDIEQARKLGNDGMPEWSDAVEALCAWDLQRLEQAAGDDSTLGSYLQFLAHEIDGSETARLTAAEQLWHRDRRCFRAADTLAQENSLAIRGMIAAAGLNNIDVQLPVLLAAVPNLPAPVRRVLEKHGRLSAEQPRAALGKRKEIGELLWLPELVEALQKAGTATEDRQEPSWQLMAAIIDDAVLVHVLSRLELDRFKLSVDTTETIQELRPLVRNHVLASHLDCYSSNVETARTAARLFVPILSRLEFSAGSQPLLQLMWLDPGLQDIYRRIQKQSDLVVWDLIAHLRSQGEAGKSDAWRELYVLAPDCPVTVAARIQLASPKVEPSDSELEEQYANYPDVLRSLATKHEMTDRLDDAERCLVQLTKIRPEPSSFWPLEEVYRKRNDWESRKRTLQQILLLPAYSLEHPRAASKLAYGLMDRGEWSEARKYAEMAAGSYSAWGLSCAAECYEGLRMWELAEDMMQALAERYEGSQQRWYYWCRRTGKGDVVAARKLAEESLQREIRLAGNRSLFRQAYYRELDGDSLAAYDLMVQSIQAAPEGARIDNSHNMFLAAVLAHKLGRIENRDEWIRKVASNPEHEMRPCLARALLLAQRGTSSFPGQDELEWYLALNLGEGGPTDGCYFIGKCLQMLGQDEKAVDWLRRCASSPERQKYTAILAGAELVRLSHGVPLRSASELKAEYQRSVELLREGFRFAGSRSHQQALSKYLAAAKSAPDWLYVQYPLAVAYRELKQLDEAERACSRIIEAIPTLTDLYRYRGKLREERLDTRGAIADYEAALQIEPENGSLHNNLGWIRAATPDDELRDGERALDHALKSQGGTPDLRWVELGLQAAAHAELGRFDEAVKLQEESLAALTSGDINDRMAAEDRLDGYRKGLPYRRLPASVPLLTTLPEDGCQVNYLIQIKSGDDQHELKLHVRSVGQFQQDGNVLRCLELELQSEHPLIPASIHRLLIPEQAFGRWKNPLDRAVRMWVRKADAMAEAFDGLNGDPHLKFFLAGATNVTRRVTAGESIQWQNQLLPCEAFHGGSMWMSGEQNHFFANWTIKRNDRIPFELVTAHLDLTVNQKKFDVTVALDDLQTDARAALPEFVP